MEADSDPDWVRWGRGLYQDKISLRFRRSSPFGAASPGVTDAGPFILARDFCTGGTRTPPDRRNQARIQPVSPGSRR